MSESTEENFTAQSPTDSLNRPSRIIPPGSPVKFSDLCDARRKFKSSRLESDSSSGTESSPENSISGNGMCSKDQYPECLTPKLEDSALSKMLANVADNDKHYVGGNVMPSGDESTPEGASKTVRQTPTPVECVLSFWAKAFPAHDDDISKEGSGGGGGKDPSNKRKRFPMTLTLADDRFFVVNNGRVVPDGGSLKGASSTGGKSCIRYFHEGAVMELIPGTKPAMKLINAMNPVESIDAGSAMTEKEKGSIISPIKKCWVESGFCAYLVLHYNDPEKPYLEAMNSPVLQQKLKELEKKHLTPSDEHFTPLVNIAREPDVTSKDEYTTALYFTTNKYIYFVYVDKQDLTLKKFAVGDNSPSAHPRNNMQFHDRVYLNCGQCAMYKAGSKINAKEREEVDSSEAALSEVKLKADFVEAESPSADSGDGSSNPRSSSSQLSSPEGASINNSPGNSKLLRANEKHSANNDSEILDSGVEAN